MLFTKENKVFFTILYVTLTITKESYACFSENQDHRLSIQTGNSFYRECHCTDETYSIENLKWLDINGQEISVLGPGTVPNVYTEQSGRMLSLHISNVSKTISGYYQCVTEHNGRKYAFTYKIDVYEPLYFINTDVNQFAIKGTDSLIHCEARSETGPLIVWHKGKDETMLMSDAKYEITKEGLIIYNVTEDDKGIYKCTAIDYQTGDDDDKYIKVEVMTLPVIKELKVQDNLTSGQTVVVGDFLSIECIAEGVPLPKYFWNKLSGMNSSDHNNITWHQNFNTIVFDSIVAGDEGTYECTAVNKAGEDNKQIFIEVLIPPTILKFDNITVTEGSNIELICEVIGKPKPIIKIVPSAEYNAEKALPNSNENEKESNSTYTHKLTFTEINKDHQGFYTCSAGNEVDLVTEEAYVNVHHKPYFNKTLENIWGWNGITVNMSCEHESNPASNIVWRYQGNTIPTEEQLEVNKLILSVLNSNTQYYMPLRIDRKILFGNYECTAINEFGEAKKTIILKEAFTPPAIQAVTIDSITAKSVTFKIIGPDDVEGPPINSYMSQYDEQKNFEITDIHKNRTWAIYRPYKLEKLKPNTTYMIRFAAVNEVGAGVWTDNMEFHTPEKSAPDAPSWEDKIYFIETDTGVEKIKWSAPDDNGDPIDFYVLRYCQMQEGEMKEEFCKEKQISPTTELELNLFEPNTTYYLELLAHNAEGNSTIVSTYITTPEKKPRPLMSAGLIIGVAVIIVLVAIVLLDILLFCWKRQGIMANCCFKKNKKRKESNVQTRDRKGLLKDNGDAVDDTLKRPNNGHKEYQYNKNTGVITGKHSAV